MDMCFDAFLDLAECLDISATDVAFNRKLGLAFGARGRSGAAAHYEPLQEVINLTKMHGAGSTAHEWGHALDHRLAISCGITTGQLASELRYIQAKEAGIPDSFLFLIQNLKRNEKGFTQFYQDAVCFDKSYSKCGQGYWQSSCELFARAFAVYILDKLAGTGRKDDFLVGHAEFGSLPLKDRWAYAYPKGEERKQFAVLFDQLFADLKADGFFRPYQKPVVFPVHQQEEEKVSSFDFSATTEADENGQMYFTF